jgi:multidrug efflux system outer membrane protein
MNRPFMIVWIGIGLLLGACSMTPPYTRPEAPVAQTWPGGPAYEKSGTPTDAPGVTDIPWR